MMRSTTLAVFAALVTMASARNLLAARLIRQADSQPIKMSLTSIREEDNKEIADEVIDEGKRLILTFELKVKPECPPGGGCTVQVTLANTRPDEIALSKCALLWDVRQDPEFCCDADGAEVVCKVDSQGKITSPMCEAWKKPQEIEITTVEDFVDDGMKIIEIQTNRVESQAEFYKDRSIPDVEIRTPDKGTAECRSTTDPNYRQFDGNSFTVNTQGTFTLWKAPQRDWEVQASVDDKGGNCGVAVRDGCDRVVFNRCTGSFHMKKHFNPHGDPKLQPIVSRSGSDTWILKSRRSGSQVRIVQRVHVTRAGKTVCGWSGCRTTFSTSRRDWLDVFVTAPGQDWGWVDSAKQQKSVPKITGVCGRFTSTKGDDLLVENGQATTKMLKAPQYVNQFAVQPTNNLFKLTPGKCETAKQPVQVAKKQCSIAPRPVQKPVIGVFDIEDITEMLKNSLADDEEDEGSKYVFNLGAIKPEPIRTEAFKQDMRAFCVDAMLNTKFAKQCAGEQVHATEAKVSEQAIGGKDKKMLLLPDEKAREPIDLDQFVESCYADIFWQAPECKSAGQCDAEEEDKIHIAKNAFAAASYEALEAFCIENQAKDKKYDRTCKAENAGTDGCQSTDDGICVGDCTIEAAGTLKTFVSDKCPNNCGRNYKEEGAGGSCVLLNITQTNGAKALRNRCKCDNPSRFGGDDCTVQIGDIKPTLKRLYPSKCDTFDPNQKCPEYVGVFADDTSTLFARSETKPKCKVNGVISDGLFMSDTEIRCPLDAEAQATHGGSANVDFHTVSVSTDDGAKYSENLQFCYYNSVCMSCNRNPASNGKSSVADKTCAIDGKCYARGQRDPTPTFGKCRTCQPETSQTAWTFSYEAGTECQAKCESDSMTISEASIVGQAINENNLVRRKTTGYMVHTDENNAPEYTITNSDGTFVLDAASGEIKLAKNVIFKNKATYDLDISVAQGGLTSTCTYTVNIAASDASATFVESRYETQAKETLAVGSTLAVKVAAISTASNSGAGVKYELRADTNGQALPFAIHPDTGVVTVKAALDFEKASKWDVQLLARAGEGEPGTASLIIVVTDEAEAPRDVTLETNTVSEDAVPGQFKIKVNVFDDDAGDASDATVTMKDSGEAGAAKASDYFKLENGELVLIKALDYEALQRTFSSAAISMMLTATDPTNLVSDPVKVVITVADANDAPADITVFTENRAGGTKLATIPEDQGTESPVGYLFATDDDVFDVHTFKVVGTNPYFQVPEGSNALHLIRPLDFEKADTVKVSLVADDGKATSVAITLSLAVTDSKDVPRGFQLVQDPVAVPENAAIGDKIGVVQGVDQNYNDDFTMKLAAGFEGEFTLGATTCNQDDARGTVCSADLFVLLPSAIDFEGASNRVTATTSKHPFQVEYKSQTDGEGKGDVFVTIADVAEAPTGIKLVDADKKHDTDQTVDGVVEVREGRVMIGGIRAEHGDECPQAIPGCSERSTASEYTYAIGAGKNGDLFTLTDACTDMSPTLCKLNTKDAFGLDQGLYSLDITVTDKSGNSHTVLMRLHVLKRITTLSLHPLATFHEDGEEVDLTTFPEHHHHNADVPVGTVVLKDWKTSERPELEVVKGADKFKLTVLAVRRHRRSSITFKWTLVALKGVLSVEGASETRELSIRVKGQKDASGQLLEGLEQAFSFDVVSHVPTKDTVRICDVLSSTCDWALDEATTSKPSKSIIVDGHGEPQTVLANLALTSVETLAAIPSADLKFVGEEAPNFGLFAVNRDTGVVTLNAKPISIDQGKGTGTAPSILTIKAMRGSQVVAQFDIQFVIEYCGASQECDAVGTQECVANVKSSYECKCKDGWRGVSCVSADGAQLAAKEASASDSGSSTGEIVGIVIAVLFVLVALVAAVMFVQARNARNAAAMSGLGSSSPYAANPTLGMPPQPFVRGRKNAATYPYYAPSASRQSSYQLLSSADAGAFVVRDAAGGGFHLHYKTAQNQVKDAEIATEGRSVTLSGHGDQPTFPCLPMLVEHYASNKDPYATIQLSVAKPIYFRDDGSSIYDNAAMKGVKTDYSATSSAI